MTDNEDRTRRELLRAELAKLREKGVIDVDAEQRIRGHYAASEAETQPQPAARTEPESQPVAPQKARGAKRGILWYVVRGLGIYFAFSVSISLIVAINLAFDEAWGTLSTLQRVTLAYIPVIAGALCGVYTIVRGKGRFWREASAFLTAFGFVMLASWTPKIYNIDGAPGSSDFVMFVSLPLIYIFRSYLLTALYSVFFLLCCLLSGLGVPLLRIIFRDSESGFACFMGIVPFIAYNLFFRKSAGKRTESAVMLNENLAIMMKNKKLILTLFLLTVAVGVLYPSSRIIRFASSTSQFAVFRFKAEIDDPDEPFVGRYVKFDLNKQRLPGDKKLGFDTEAVDCYAVLEEDENGLAKLVDIVRKPERGKPAIRTYNVWYSPIIRGEGQEQKTISRYSAGFPFERFDMGETPAPEAQRAFSEALRLRNECVITVKVYANGNFAITDLEMDGIPIHEFLERAAGGKEAAGQKI